jgi:hypothetical protein
MNQVSKRFVAKGLRSRGQSDRRFLQFWTREALFTVLGVAGILSVAAAKRYLGGDEPRLIAAARGQPPHCLTAAQKTFWRSSCLPPAAIKQWHTDS